MSAWGCTWPGSRRTPRSAACSTACPGCGSIPRRRRPPRAGSSSASRPRFTWCGARLSSVILDGQGLTPADVEAVARGGAQVELADAARERNRAAARALDELLERGAPVYGVTTGVGPFRTRDVPPDVRAEQQLRLLRSHASGGGPPLSAERVRAT